MILSKAKDGGPDSPVDAYFLFEFKNLLSIAILKFNQGGREQFHTHAFNALTWFICGDLIEEDVSGRIYTYTPNIIPKLTRITKNHRVRAYRDSWCLTIRGPWSRYWTEYDKNTDTTTVFSKSRKVVGHMSGVHEGNINNAEH